MNSSLANDLGISYLVVCCKNVQKNNVNMEMWCDLLCCLGDICNIIVLNEAFAVKEKNI
jgi:hypothetical protein